MEEELFYAYERDDAKTVHAGCLGDNRKGAVEPGAINLEKHVELSWIEPEELPDEDERARFYRIEYRRLAAELRVTTDTKYAVTDIDGPGTELWLGENLY